jgi:hypothetical protein
MLSDVTHKTTFNITLKESPVSKGFTPDLRFLFDTIDSARNCAWNCACLLAIMYRPQHKGESSCASIVICLMAAVPKKLYVKTLPERWQLKKLKLRLPFTQSRMKRLSLLGYLDHPRYLSMERSCNPRGGLGFLEGCSAMSLEDSPMLPQWKQFGWRLENRSICKHRCIQ